MKMTRQHHLIILLILCFGFMWWYGQSYGFAKITGPHDGLYIQSQPIGDKTQAWIVNKLEIEIISSDGGVKKFKCKQDQNGISIEGQRDKEKQYPLNSDGNFILFPTGENIGLGYDLEILMVKKDASADHSTTEILRKLQSSQE
jgi:hypothetical protein